MLRNQPQKSFRSGYLCTKSNQGDFGMLYHITMKQHSNPQSHLLRCHFEKDCNSILLSDMKKNLLRLNLNNLNYTPILSGKVSFFQFYSYSCEKIYVVSSQNQSKLYLVNTINKKWQMFSLNINKIVAFEINLLRNLILVADPVILSLIDQRTKQDCKVYKPSKSRILKAMFTANNRSFLVLSEDMNLKQIGIHTLAQEFSIYLPFDPQCADMAIRGDNQHLFVYGSNRHAFIVTNISEDSPTITTLSLPVKIKQAKFDLEGNIVILGKDQIIYYLAIGAMRLVRLFNHENQHVIHSLDISLDNKLVCCVSNFGALLIYSLKQTLVLLKQKPSLFEETIVDVDAQYEKECEMQVKKAGVQPEEDNEDYFQGLAQQVPSESFYYPENQEGGQVYLPEGTDNEIKQTFKALKFKLGMDEFFKQNPEQIVQVIYAFKRLMRQDSNSTILFFLRWIISSQQVGKQMSLMYCPEVVTIVQNRFNLQFQDFVFKSTCQLFLDYFDEGDWIQIVKFLLRNKDRPETLVVFFLCLLKTTHSSVKRCPTLESFEGFLRSQKNINLQQLFTLTLQTCDNSKYTRLFQNLRQKASHRTPAQPVQIGHSDQEAQSEPERRGSSRQKINRLLERQKELEGGLDSLNSKRQMLNNSN